MNANGSDSPAPKWAMPTLILGALAIGFSPIFVRLSEIGPIATAFNRVVLALPFFYDMVWLQPKAATRAACTRAVLIPTFIGGVFFACDLCFRAGVLLQGNRLGLRHVQHPLLKLLQGQVWMFRLELLE